MKKVAVILSGAGVFDGSEIHEAVLALHAIEQAGASWHCFAPDMDQHHVINHMTGEPMHETRNVLVEASRIARGQIQNITELSARDFDALLLPGGFGAAKNLSDFAFQGAQCQIHPEVKRACQEFAKAQKPAGYLCIAPVLIPQIYGKDAKGTIGHDKDVASAFRAMGGDHIECPVDEFVLDQERCLLSTPAYMMAGSISEAASGINKLVQHLVKMA
ncbi:isoprenoid biosynthesis glyoxalase ElbB [Photobacterium sp. 1_MG-2023]|uniref:isoprenoid biosynthesis glyoxalase ElbB n=1 Tax=Photobacterium sp. 1_MG-2023 TaxID=3062646 RepID=UPI0026E1609D|nr:isoprenoid biosynthesis glyoxalase ElbB [Photobacterium sp. 1_MG-2023]MDO6707452.1 isoprenoid biosynthesis glyoxalase ElbB [Photobacterium sp. 1_MG-2023]